jgi:hypothetical protein
MHYWTSKQVDWETFESRQIMAFRQSSLVQRMRCIGGIRFDVYNNFTSARSYPPAHLFLLQHHVSHHWVLPPVQWARCTHALTVDLFTSLCSCCDLNLEFFQLLHLNFSGWRALKGVFTWDWSFFFLVLILCCGGSSLLQLYWKQSFSGLQGKRITRARSLCTY